MRGQEYLKNVVTLNYNADKCTGCGLCTDVCPHAVFELEEKKAAIIARDSCMECGACASNCPVEAIEVRSGVGCAAGIIVGSLRGTEAACDCSGKPDEPSCCGQG